MSDIHELRQEDSLSADIHESVAGENIIGRASNIQPGTDTVSLEVDPTHVAAHVFAFPEDAEYDTVWVHGREDAEPTFTDHLTPVVPAEAADPPHQQVTHTDVIDWGDHRPNQTLVVCDHLVGVFNELEHGRIDSLTVHIDDAGLVAFDSDDLDVGYLVAPQFTSEHPEVSNEEVAELRASQEAEA